MSVFHGKDGAFVLGGILDGAPLVQGALAQGATQMNIDAQPTLYGVVMAGDTFTLAGEAGTPTHTVTGGPYVAVANAIANITFTPAIAAGGVGDNAAVTFTANSVAQVTKWDCAVDLEVVQQGFMGLHWLKTAGGFGKWSGSAEVALDYGDAKQAKFVDAIATASPPGVPVGLVLRSATSKQLYGSAVPNGLRITQTVGALVTVAFNFTGDGAILADWH